jgi:hypothetical protein
MTQDVEYYIKLLQQYGPWALVVFLSIAIVFLYFNTNKKLEKKDISYGQLLEKRHDQFIQVLTDCASTLQQAKDEIKETKDLNKKLEELLTTIKTLLLTIKK